MIRNFITNLSTLIIIVLVKIAIILGLIKLGKYFFAKLGIITMNDMMLSIAGIVLVILIIISLILTIKGFSVNKFFTKKEE